MIERMWINQPSMLQPHFELHGTRVLAVPEKHDPDYMRVYFLDGDVISMTMNSRCLSHGWPKGT